MPGESLRGTSKVEPCKQMRGTQFFTLQPDERGDPGLKMGLFETAAKGVSSR
jgi:hypothetical protein